MPLKQAVLPLLDGVSDLARAVGAVNTVTLACRTSAPGTTRTSRGILAALAGGGVDRATGCGRPRRRGHCGVRTGRPGRGSASLEPVVVVRSSARSAPLLEAAGRLGVRPQLVGWDAAPELAVSASVVVSTVPRGRGGRCWRPVWAARRGSPARRRLPALADPARDRLGSRWRRGGLRAGDAGAPGRRAGRALDRAAPGHRCDALGGARRPPGGRSSTPSLSVTRPVPVKTRR